MSSKGFQNICKITSLRGWATSAIPIFPQHFGITVSSMFFISLTLHIMFLECHIWDCSIETLELCCVERYNSVLREALFQGWVLYFEARPPSHLQNCATNLCIEQSANRLVHLQKQLYISRRSMDPGRDMALSMSPRFYCKIEVILWL